MKGRVLLGAAAALLLSTLSPVHAQTHPSLTEIMKQLRAVQKKNAAMEKENTALRERIRRLRGIRRPAPELAKAANAPVAPSFEALSSEGIKGPAPTFSPVPSGWYIDGSFDRLAANRNGTDGLMVRPISTNASVISGQDFPFHTTFPFDAQVRVGFRQFGVEARYMGGFQFKSSIPNLGPVGNVQIGSFSNFGATGLNAAENNTFSSLEINGRWQALPWLAAFAGYRSIRLFDESELTITFPAFAATYFYSVPWQGSGPQIGAQVRLFGPGTNWMPGPIFGDVDGRVGFLHVESNPTFNLIPTTGGSFPGAAPQFTKNGVNIYEIGGTLGYQITPNIIVRAGYRYIALNDALFANDYVVASTANQSQNVLPKPRQLDLQMATVGTEVMFSSN